MMLLLDVDGCMYDAFKELGKSEGLKNFSAYRAHTRVADMNWATRETGRSAEEFNEYRRAHAPQVGMDKALLDFISLHTGKEFGIKELAIYRCGEFGYQPERILEPNEKLVQCLQHAKELGNRLVVVTDNPVTLRTIRQLGIKEDLIPDEMVFGPERMGSFKGKIFLERVLKELGALPEEAAMFGDSECSDIIPAKEAGIQKVFLTKGPEALIQAVESVI